MTIIDKVKGFFSKLFKKDKVAESEKIDSCNEKEVLQENEEVIEENINVELEENDCKNEENKDCEIEEEITIKEATLNVSEEKIEEQPLKEQKIEEVIESEEENVENVIEVDQEENVVEEEIVEEEVTDVVEEAQQEDSVEEVQEEVIEPVQQEVNDNEVVEEDNQQEEKAEDKINLEFLASLDKKRLIDVKDEWTVKIDDVEKVVHEFEAEGLIESKENEKLLSGFTVKDLKEICKTNDIKIKSSARKQEIIEIILSDASSEVLAEILKEVKYYTLTKKAKELL